MYLVMEPSPVNQAVAGWASPSCGAEYRLLAGNIVLSGRQLQSAPNLQRCAFWRLSCLTSWLSVCCAARVAGWISNCWQPASR
ncbi:hypothetical protein ACVXHA_09525 [Escherichia coli]